MPENHARNSENESDINLIDLFIVLAKNKWMIAGVTVGAGVLVFITSMFMPPVYRAETKIFIPSTEATSFSAQLMDQATPIATLMGGSNLVGTNATKNNLYVEILKSRSVRDRIIDRFDLEKGGGGKTREHVQISLSESVKVKTDIKSGVITLGVEDNNPQKAAAIANAFVEEFWRIGKEFALAESSQRRLLFEDQLNEAREALLEAENAIKGLQDKSGDVKPDLLAEGLISAISQLRAQIAVKEIQIKAMRTYSTSRAVEVQMAEEELKVMREKLRCLESGNVGDAVAVPRKDITAASTEHARKIGDLAYAETFYDLLQGQYHSLRLDEAKNRMVVQVIEKAEPPVKAEKPRRFVLVFLAVIAGFLISVIATFAGDFKERVLLDPRNSERIKILKKYLFS